MASSLAYLTNNDLSEEIEAINAIFEPDTISLTSSPRSTASTLDLGGTGTTNLEASSTTRLKLQIPNHPNLSFLLDLDETYPAIPPRVIGTASTASRGEGSIALNALEEIVQRVFEPGAVCLFDVINESVEAFRELHIGGGEDGDAVAQQDKSLSETTESGVMASFQSDQVPVKDLAKWSLKDTFGLESPPVWILSDVVTEKKSVFVGRAAHVTSLEQARAFLDHLLATEKKVAAATHNISAWRIRQKKPSPGKGGEFTETIIQDCDDDGETAAGGRLLHLMQLMDAWDVIVVVTRWYGGVLLGPDRFRIINGVGRDALLKGGFTKESTSGNQNRAKKKGKK